MFEELVDPPRDSSAVLPFAVSTASAATVGSSTVSTTVIGIPTASTATVGPPTVSAGTIGIPSGSAAAVRIAADTTVVDSTTVNAQVVSTCTNDTLVSPDAELCQKFVNDTCGCMKNDGKACSGLFSLDHYIELRAQTSLLTRNELDLTLMGSMMSTLLMDDVAWSRHKPTKRCRFCQQYMHHGHTICKTTFMFLYGIGKKRLQNVKDAYHQNGLEVRVHKNSRSLPHNYLSFDVIHNFKQFLINYAEENAILLPGRVPGYKKDDIKLLPSSRSKRVSTNPMCTKWIVNVY